MSEAKTGLASLGLDNAIRLRWVLRDIIGKRLKFSPIAPNDLQTLIDLGYIEMKDEVPTVTTAGLDAIAIGNLPSDRGRDWIESAGARHMPGRADSRGRARRQGRS